MAVSVPSPTYRYHSNSPAVVPARFRHSLVMNKALAMQVDDVESGYHWRNQLANYYFGCSYGKLLLLRDEVSEKVILTRILISELNILMRTHSSSVV